MRIPTENTTSNLAYFVFIVSLLFFGIAFATIGTVCVVEAITSDKNISHCYMINSNDKYYVYGHVDWARDIPIHTDTNFSRAVEIMVAYPECKKSGALKAEKEIVEVEADE